MAENMRKRYPHEIYTMGIDAFPPDCELPGPNPTPKLINSLRENGQRRPVEITIFEQKVVVLNGTRRIKAARKLNWQDVEVDYIPDLTAEEIRQWIVSANNDQTDNPIRDMQTVLEYVKLGATPQQTAKKLNLTVSEVKRLIDLGGLPEPILKGIETGKVAMGVAKQIVHLGPNRQQELVPVLQQAGKLTGADVRTVRQVSVAQTVASLDLPGMDWQPEPDMYVICHDGCLVTPTPLSWDEVQQFPHDSYRGFTETFRLVKVEHAPAQ
jgi:ParB/RepB/Spo0J family partition protein